METLVQFEKVLHGELPKSTVIPRCSAYSGPRGRTIPFNNTEYFLRVRNVTTSKVATKSLFHLIIILTFAQSISQIIPFVSNSTPGMMDRKRCSRAQGKQGVVEERNPELSLTFPTMPFQRLGADAGTKMFPGSDVSNFPKGSPLTPPVSIAFSLAYDMRNGYSKICFNYRRTKRGNLQRQDTRCPALRTRAVG